MKKWFLVVGLLAVLQGLHAQKKDTPVAYIAVKNAELKSSTAFFASVSGTLSYGEAVAVLEVKNNWVHVISVANSSIAGWISVNSLSAKRIIPGSASTATASEVALTGKGFNQEIENVYKTKGNLNYAAVDKTESKGVSKQTLYNFLIAGNLFQGGVE